MRHSVYADTVSGLADYNFSDDVRFAVGEQKQESTDDNSCKYSFYIIRKVKFYKRMSRKKGFSNDIFTVYSLDNCSYDECLQSVFVPLYEWMKEWMNEWMKRKFI